MRCVRYCTVRWAELNRAAQLAAAAEALDPGAPALRPLTATSMEATAAAGDVASLLLRMFHPDMASHRPKRARVAAM